MTTSGRFGREDDVPVAVGQIHHRVEAGPAAPRTDRVYEQERRARERAAGTAVLRPEIFDAAAVAVVAEALAGLHAGELGAGLGGGKPV
jgi:hypothetical protein